MPPICGRWRTSRTFLQRSKTKRMRVRGLRKAVFFTPHLHSRLPHKNTIWWANMFLFSIFVGEKLDAYIKFYDQHKVKDYVNQSCRKPGILEYGIPASEDICFKWLFAESVQTILAFQRSLEFLQDWRQLHPDKTNNFKLS